MQQPILTPQQLEAYNRGEAVTIQKVKEVNRKWKPMPQDPYYAIGFSDKLSELIAEEEWSDYSTELWLYENYLAFHTKEELQKQMQYIEAVSYIRTYIANNFGEWKPDWEDDTQAKWLPSFSHNDKKWKPYFSTNIQHAGRISPLKTVIECDQLIKDCEPQLNILRDFFN